MPSVTDQTISSTPKNCETCLASARPWFSSTDTVISSLSSCGTSFPVEILGTDWPGLMLPACLRPVKSIQGMDE